MESMSWTVMFIGSVDTSQMLATEDIF